MEKQEHKKSHQPIWVGLGVLVGLLMLAVVFIGLAVHNFELQVQVDADKKYRLAKAVYAGEVTEDYIQDAIYYAYGDNDGPGAKFIRAYPGKITPAAEARDKRLSLALFQCYIAQHCGGYSGASWDMVVRTYCGGPQPITASARDDWAAGTHLDWLRAVYKIIKGDV